MYNLRLLLFTPLKPNPISSQNESVSKTFSNMVTVVRTFATETYTITNCYRTVRSRIAAASCKYG